MAAETVTIEDVHAARTMLDGKVRHTPMIESPVLGRIAGVPVHLKLETMQDIGAFKIRGATNKLASLRAEDRRRGAVAVSTGNHGRGVAAAAKALGMRCVVCMGNLVPENKVQGIRDLGAEVRIVGNSQDDAEIEAKRLVTDEGMIEAHPFDDAHVIAGQGTIGLEILEDLPDVKTAIVPLSGGGLLGGTALALKSSKPDIRIIGVSMERGPAMIESLKAGKPVPVTEKESLADSLGGGIGLGNRLTFDLCRDLMDEWHLLSEEQIARAMAHCFWQERLVVEGGGSVGVGALLEDFIDNLEGPVAVVVSGRNVDMNNLHDIADRHRPD